MSIFDDKGPSTQSSADELADAIKASPELAPAPAPEPKPEPASETPPPEATEAATDATEQPPAPRHVPAAAVSEEREKRRAAETQLAELKGRLDTMERMFQPQPQQPQQAEQPPDPEQDPIGALRWERQERERLQGYVRQQAIEQRVTQDYVADVGRFAGQQRDFPLAYDHLLHQRVAELQAQNYPPEAIRHQIRNEEMSIVFGALRAGRSPAQALYDLAKTRGYAPRSAASATPAAPVDPVLQEVKRKAATGISEGGSAPRGDMSLEDIGKLSGAAFDSAFEKYARTAGKRSTIFRHN